MSAVKRPIPGTFSKVPGGYAQTINGRTTFFVPDMCASSFIPETGELYGYSPDYDALEAEKLPAVQAEAPGEYAYYYETQHAPNDCDYSADLVAGVHALAAVSHRPSVFTSPALYHFISLCHISQTTPPKPTNTISAATHPAGHPSITPPSAAIISTIAATRQKSFQNCFMFHVSPLPLRCYSTGAACCFAMYLLTSSRGMRQRRGPTLLPVISPSLSSLRTVSGFICKIAVYCDTVSTTGSRATSSVFVVSLIPVSFLLFFKSCLLYF